ncbi:MAG: BatA domain-containing protein [bacterium]
MSFLQPLFLAGLALAAIPLILHLFTRQKYIEVPFSSLFFLERSRRRSFRTISLHHLLVLLARMLVVVFVTLAFAAPLLKARLWGAGEGRAPAEIFLIVDNSLSTKWHQRGVSTYDRIREAARRVAGAAAAGDTVRLIFLCGARSGETLSSANMPIAEMLKDIKESNAGLCRGDIGAAARRAMQEISNSPPGVAEAKIVILTDAQIKSMDFQPLPGPARPVTVVVVDAVAGAERENATIVPADLPGQAIQGEPLSLCFDVRGDLREGAAVSLSIDGEPRGERSVGTAGGSVCFHTTLTKTGTHYGSARLTPDALEADNTRYFILEVIDAVEAAVLADREDVEDPAHDAYYIVRAFRAAAAAGPGFQSVRATVTPAAGAEDLPFANFRLVVAPSGTLLTLEGLRRLNDFAKRGGGILVFAEGGDPSAKAVAETLFDGEVVFPSAGESAGDGGTGGFVRVEKLDAGHPAFSASPGVSKGLMEARFPRVAGVEVSSGEIAPIMTLKNGRALLVERKIGKGRALLFASGVQPYRSSFSLQPVFLPAVLGLCRYLGGLWELPRREFACARPLSLPLEGDRRTLKALAPADGGSFELVRRGGRGFTTADGEPLPPGVYEVENKKDGAPPFLVAINVEPEEGALETAPPKEFRKKFPGFRHRAVGIKGGDWRERLVGEVFAREHTALLPIFLVAALGMVFLDVFLSNRS